MFATQLKAVILSLVVAGALTVCAPVAGAQEYPADNSGKNVRDRAAGAVTAGKQSSAPSDVKITQQIRRAVVADKQLSTNAHNVKIITTDGVVTLRGPVKTVKEKHAIGAKAQRVAGVSRVDNQLEVTGHN